MEVYHNGVWGTVCDDGWDLNDAQVVCNELGYGRATAAKYSAFYGQGSGKVWLCNLDCVGTEGIIEDCSHGGWAINYCSHSKDAGVKCSAGNVLTKAKNLKILLIKGNFLQTLGLKQSKFLRVLTLNEI